MTQPRLAHATDRGRMYARRVGGEPQVPSITTVIGVERPDLDGWVGWMAASAAVNDPRLPEAVGSSGRLRQIARSAADAAAAYRDQAAERGDRVHDYAEQVSLRHLGRPHRMAEARQALLHHGEGAYADRFDEWWDLYGVEPLAAEVTVWNHSVGYAGTLDLVARIGGRLCLIDFKTKTTGRDGRVKPLDAKVVMQLVAGLKAEESLVDAEAGTWEPWAHGGAQMLLGVALGETEVAVHQANPAVLKQHWHKFWALRQVWKHQAQTIQAGPALGIIGPPPTTIAASESSTSASGSPAPTSPADPGAATVASGSPESAPQEG
ncbi:cytochrome [uncultured Micrococcus sp.]|uniref:cytochrome n=1 Tax=uncultured Micrococcus sp. TaxID=114051 RepID=UPI0021CB5BA4|nr:cytochrome [uncultured Micrococcus sp.]